MKLSLKSIKNRLRSKWIEWVKNRNCAQLLDYDKQPIYLCDNVRLGSCKKEPETISWIETFSGNDVFFDIGTNIGAYALVAAKYCKTVYAFEPAIMNYQLLCKNIVTNVKRGFGKNIVPVHMAFSDQNKIEYLNYVNLNDGKSGHQIKDRTTDYAGATFVPAYRLGVSAMTLDSFCEVLGVPAPQHIKIDVDGLEPVILRGALKTLSGDGVKTVLVETNKLMPDYELIKKMMADCGFVLEKEHALSLEQNEVNCLFAKRR